MGAKGLGGVWVCGSAARSWTILGGGGGAEEWSPKSSGGRDGSFSSFAGGGRGLVGMSDRGMRRGVGRPGGGMSVMRRGKEGPERS
ncbi:hypothetical protein BD309DRAFT_950198 [Dichomitus squalens]|nr:hypothetical protein BD309DRAFT_950198 [Dichomitus squalens]